MGGAARLKSARPPHHFDAMKNTHETYNRQEWNNENHADRAGWKPKPYACDELLAWIAGGKGRDTDLIRWYISTQNGTGASHDRPSGSPF